jgi:hypothetical protein
MTISDYQISSVIRTYVKNMKVRINPTDDFLDRDQPEDAVSVSEEGMKRMLFERIGEKMTERLKRHESDK